MADGGERQALISLLEMLNLQQYVAELVTPAGSSQRATTAAAENSASEEACGAPRTVGSIADLEKYPTTWERVIKKRHHRDILGGYLAVRAKKFRSAGDSGGEEGAAAAAQRAAAADADASERRFETFRTIKAVLADLRELQLKKAQLDQRQAAIIQGRSTANVATRQAQQRERLRKPAPGLGAEGAKQPEPPTMTAEEELASVRDEIIATVERIDSAKDRLEVAQEMLGFATGAAGGGAVRSAKRPTVPGLSTSNRPATGGVAARKPAVPRAEAKPAPPPVLKPTASSEGPSPSTASEPDEATESEAAPAGPSSTTTESDRRRANRAPAAGGADRNRTTFDDVEFGPRVSPTSDSYRPASSAGASTCHGASFANSVGPGWFRSLPRTRTEVQSSNRAQAAVSREKQRRDMASTFARRLDEQVAEAVTAADAAGRNKWGKRQPPTPPAAAAAANPTKRNLATATFRPRTASAVRKGAAARNTDQAPLASHTIAAAVRKRDAFADHATLQVAGCPANTLALGLATPLDHGAQMRCGAIIDGASRMKAPL